MPLGQLHFFQDSLESGQLQWKLHGSHGNLEGGVGGRGSKGGKEGGREGGRERKGGRGREGGMTSHTSHMWSHDLPHLPQWSHDLPHLPHVVT